MKRMFLISLLLLSNFAFAQTESESTIRENILSYSNSIKKGERLEANYIERGNLYFKLNQYENAISDFTSSMKYNRGNILGMDISNNTEAWGGRGLCKFFLNDYQGVVEDLTTALYYNPKNISYLIFRAISFGLLSNFDKAIDDYTQLIDAKAFFIDSANSNFRFDRGVCYLQKGKFRLAINDLETALTLSPTNSKIWNARGMAYLHLARYDSAIHDFSKAIALDSNSFKYWENRAEGYFLKKQFDSAAYNDYQAYIKNSNPFSALLSKIDYNEDLLKLELQPFFNKMLEYEKQKDYTNAIEQCNQILIKDSLNRDALFQRGHYHIQQKKYKSAIKDFQAIEDIEGRGMVLRSQFELIYQSNGFFYNYLGLAYAKAGEGDSAILTFTKAIERDTLNYVFYCNRGSSYYYMQKDDSALFDLKKSVALNSNYGEAWSYLGLSYTTKGDYDAAIECYDKCLKLEPKESNLTLLLNKLFLFYELQRSDFDLSSFPSNGDNSGEYISLGVKQYLEKLNLQKLDPYINLTNALGDYIAFVKLLYSLQQQKYDESFKIYKHALVKGNLLVSNFMNIGFLKNYVIACTEYLRDKKNTEALRFLELSIKLFDEVPAINIPDDNIFHSIFSNVLLTAGIASENLKNYKLAQSYYLKAQILNPYGRLIKHRLTEILKKIESEKSHDHLPPTIEVTSYDINNADMLSLTGYARDISGVAKITINTIQVKNIDEESGFFTAQIPYLKQDISFTATDKKGNSKIHVIKYEQITNRIRVTKKGRFYAIIIACDIYKPSTKLKPLPYCIMEARELKEVISTQYNFDEKDICTLYNPARNDILVQLTAKISQLTQDDNLLIFYSGHGKVVLGPSPVSYWIPPDAKTENDYIGPKNIADLLENCKAKHVLIISDACFSGYMKIDKRNSENDNELDNKNSREVMTSSGFDKVQGKSNFMSAMIKVLNENNEQKLDVRKLYSLIKVEMKKSDVNNLKGSSDLPQLYQFESDASLGGHFIFTKPN